MKNLIIAADLCLGMVACSAQGEAAILTPPPAVAFSNPQIVPVWWAGPTTVCHRGYYGGAWCRPARPLGWIPPHRDWNGYWVPGHWG